MRVFLCAFRGFSLAIPLRFVASLTIQAGEPAREDQNTYVSLPQLFNAAPEEICHGVILKNPGDTGDATGKKIILLTTEVLCETEIPDDEIYPLPLALGRRFLAPFSGIQFDSRGLSGAEGTPVLFLDLEKLVQGIQKEQAV